MEKNPASTYAIQECIKIHTHEAARKSTWATLKNLALQPQYHAFNISVYSF